MRSHPWCFIIACSLFNCQTLNFFLKKPPRKLKKFIERQIWNEVKWQTCEHWFSSVDASETSCVWRQKEKFSKNPEEEFEKSSRKESHKRSVLLWSELRSGKEEEPGHTFEVQRRVFPLIRLTAEAIAEARNPNISDVFELYCSLSDRKERGSFTFSGCGGSSFESKLLDSARDDMCYTVILLTR